VVEQQAMSARHGVVFARVSLPGLREVPMHVVYAADGAGPPEPFVPLIHYVLETDGTRRLAWQQEVAAAVRLLLDFVTARGAPGAPVGTDTLRAFAEALLSGTRHLDAKERGDLSWAPRTRDRASRCLNVITAFLDWLAARTGTPAANPMRPATPAERLVRARHLDQRAAASLLSHAAYRHRDAVAAGEVREVQITRRSSSAPFDEARAFDEGAFQRLLAEGWPRPASPYAPLPRRLRIREVLISILLHFGDLRLSEPFHLYVGDVEEDPLRPGSALVRLFHPEQGRAPEEGGRRWRNRELYLRDRWHRVPRTLERGRFHAGWKNLALSDGPAKAAVVDWFPSTWGVVFLRLFRVYLHQRPRLAHPFLFTSEHPAHRGEPYTREAFVQAHARAVRRIGLLPSKAGGTSPHGHRHAYGLRLRRAGVPPMFLQRAMHHRSIESQAVYTGPTRAELAAALREAESKMAPTPTLLEELTHGSD
jgi:hypothetical protein